MKFRSTEELEEYLSTPNTADEAALGAVDGDLLILGVAGKMGPTLARRAKLAAPKKRVIGVARFSDPELRRRLEEWGIETITSDLLEPGALHRLPDAPNVIYMAARKFGSTGDEALTWAMNTFLPGLVAERYKDSRIVSFSTGNVYPLSAVLRGGPDETVAPAPVGEYGQSALGRERMFQYFSGRYGTPGAILRLNYAVELRYGVLLDIGTKVFERRPVDLRMGSVNVIWQGDANSVTLRCLPLCQTPPLVVNLTGPETLPVRWIAEKFGKHFGIEPDFDGHEADNALLSNAAKCQRLFGYPTVSVDQMIEWVATWIGMGGATHNKPTHFETRDGKF